MLLEKIGYVVEIVSIFGRTTAVMHQLLFRLMTHPRFFEIFPPYYYIIKGITKKKE